MSDAHALPPPPIPGALGISVPRAPRTPTFDGRRQRDAFAKQIGLFVLFGFTLGTAAMVALGLT
jgi:hypothetical protein